MATRRALQALLKALQERNERAWLEQRPAVLKERGQPSVAVSGGQVAPDLPWLVRLMRALESGVETAAEYPAGVVRGTRLLPTLPARAYGALTAPQTLGERIAAAIVPGGRPFPALSPGAAFKRRQIQARVRRLQYQAWLERVNAPQNEIAQTLSILGELTPGLLATEPLGGLPAAASLPLRMATGFGLEAAGRGASPELIARRTLEGATYPVVLSEDLVDIPWSALQSLAAQLQPLEPPASPPSPRRKRARPP
jgi:hypothetical protein